MSNANEAGQNAGLDKLLSEAGRRATRYLHDLPGRAVVPSAQALGALAHFDRALPELGTDAASVLAELDDLGSPATVASAGGRYFGLVIGGALPATVAANWLATAWDQNAVFRWTSPVAAQLEDVALGWLRDLLQLPPGGAGAFVSGASMATVTALAAARHALLAREGWDVEARGLFGAPELRVIVSQEVHVTVLKALSLIGMGRDRVIRAPIDAQGRIGIDTLPEMDARTIVCIQAGNVNTGGFDPAEAICARARAAGAWVHVDGAFGLWALAAPARASLAAGFPEADSWATDAHKWLNVPYDSGLAFVREPAHLRAAMAASAAYLAEGGEPAREPSHYTPELSRRARGVEVWAALRNLGRAGVADLIERSCRHASSIGSTVHVQGSGE